MSSSTVPAYGGEAGHVVGYDYAVGTNPLMTSITEGTKTITTAVDLLGRVASYTDVWAKTTTSTYDQAGRRTDTAGPAGAVPTTYDPAGRVKTQSLDGALLATATYDGAGELASAAYAATLNGGNGTSLSAITRHPTGMTTGLTWAINGGSLVDVVTRSQSAKVVDETLDGSDANSPGPNFTYDAAGRLVTAKVVGHDLAYGFATSGGCGAQGAPGRNTNRTSVTDNTGMPTTYCYNQADQLTLSSDAAVGTPTYDSHGNTQTMGAQRLIYDGTDAHVETKVNGTTMVRYGRDGTGRITSRTEGSATTHYGFTGPGDSASFTMDASNNITERTIALVGGVLVTKRGGLLGAGDVWSYPNVHGDVMATADNSGAKQGATATYDPFGKALGPLLDNSAGNFDYGWLGQAQRPIEHAGALATIEMGARQYVPSLGRFLEVDPVEGGSANDYDYVDGDPVNGRDLTGQWSMCTQCFITAARVAQTKALDDNCHARGNYDRGVPYSNTCTRLLNAEAMADPKRIREKGDVLTRFQCPAWLSGTSQLFGLGGFARAASGSNSFKDGPLTYLIGESERVAGISSSLIFKGGAWLTAIATATDGACEAKSRFG